MDETVILWLTSHYLLQVASVSCCRVPGSVEVRVEFGPFPPVQEADRYSLTIFSEENQTLWLDVSDGAGCESDCSFVLHKPLESETFNVDIKSIKNDVILMTKSFRINPEPTSSLTVEATVTSAFFSWRDEAGDHSCSLRLGTDLWIVPRHRTSYRVGGLQPATSHNFTVEFMTSVPGLNVTVRRKLNVLLETAQCPAGWAHSDTSCFRAWRRGRLWMEAGEACNSTAPGSHLADVEREEDFLLISAYLSALNHMVLVWTGLNDLQQEGRLQWSNGAAYSLNSTVTSSLPANETDCFALQMNATSPSYFFTGFFCYMALPYLCQYRLPPAPVRFALTLLAVQDTEAMIGWSDVEEWWHTRGAPELILQYQEDGFGVQPHRRRVRPPSREETVPDLTPGRVYLFSLRATHPSGAVQTLGSVLTVCSRPSAPQSLSVSKVTSTELAVQWSAPDSSHDALFHQYRLSWEDSASGLKRSMVLQKHITSAVIGGLEPYHAYTVSVQTVTDRGVASCGGSAFTVVTAVSPPAGVFVYADDIREDSLTVVWDPPPGEGLDGYFVLVRAHTESADPREFWVKDSLRFQLETLSPGRTYEIGVAAVINSNRSEVKTLLHTLRPRPVTVALPYEVSSHWVALFVQRPAVGVLEGVTVRWEGGSHFQPLSDGEDRVTVDGLTPGTVYNFSVCSTSAGADSSAYSVPAVQTCLVAPAGLREGEVTDSSVEILWDAPEGQGLSYEVICTLCSTAVQVQKVSVERVVFSGLGPGQLFNFSVRSEKEGFRDSASVFRTFRTAPRAAEWLPHTTTCTSLTVRWSRPPGVIDGFVLSVSNDTYKTMKNFTASDLRMHCFEGLSPGSDYRVDLLSSSGEKMSVPATVNLSTVPAAPEDLTLVQRHDDSVFVSWRPPRGQVEGYQLRYGASAVRETQRNLSAAESSIGVENLTPGAEYRFTLQSLRRAGTSEPASKHILMRPPRLCRLSLTKVNTSSVGLVWDAAAGLFDHYRLTVANASATQEVLLPPEALSYTVSGLRDGCSYDLTMERVRGAVTGRAALLTVTTVPASPKALRVSSVSSHSFSLRWAGPSGCVDRYQVDLNPAQGRVTVRSVENGEIQADVLTVTPGMSYSTTVTAVASSGFSASVSRSITTEESIPDAPTDLRGKHMGFAGILVSWNVPDPANGEILSYAIKYKEVCPYPESSFNQITSDGAEQLFNRLTPGSVYNIKVAARNAAGLGAFSKSLFFKTAEASPGPVTNLTAFATNHSAVRVSWFLPKQTNGLITIFTVKVRHARTNTVVNELKLNAEDIVDGVLPHCNDAVDILSRGTPSPLEMSVQTAASSPPITQSAVPPAASWNIPISITVDQLRPYTAYVFEVSAHTDKNDGQIAISMVRMPESAPEDPPQNLTASDVTSKSFSLSWDPPTILTGRFSYVVELHGPSGYLFENATSDLRFMYSALSPYTQYQVVARARSAGALGPEAQISVLTPAEAPSAVTGLVAEAVDATSVQVSWSSPSQPNGLITQYKILVLIRGMLIQNITLVGPEDLNETDSGGAGVLSRRARDAGGLLLRYRREALTPLTDAPSESTSAYFLSAASASNRPGTATDGSAHPSSASPITSGHSLSPAPDTTSSPSWLTDSTPHPTPRTAHDPQTRGVATLTLSSDSAPTGGAEVPSLHGASPGQPRLSTRAAVAADVTSDVTAPTVDMVSSTKVIDVSADHISYVVTNLSPFTEYTFSVSAFTTVGEGPLSETQEKTREQVPSSVQNVTYQNISSSSILISWEPPLNPNGKITHYTVYLLDLTTQEAFQRTTNETTLLLSELKKYNSYKLRVTASTTVGESDLSEENNVFAVTMEDEPDSPPVKLTAYNVTATSATIAWSPPVLANGVIQFYQIQFWNSTMSSEFNSTTPSMPVEGLKPFSFYNVSVRAFTRLGDGNQSSEVLELLSGEDVPGSPPYDLIYESLSSSAVNVSWAAPLTPNGAILFYNVEYWNSTHSLNATTPTTHAVLSNLRKYAHYRLFVRASTSQGSGNYTSDFLNVTTLEDVPSSPPRNLHARKVSDTQVELSWAPPLEANSEILYYVVSVWNVTSQQTQNVTTTSVILDVDKDSRYNASVSSWTRLGNGGIFLSIIINAFDAVPTDPPQNVSYVSLSPTSIRVMWSPPTQPNGVIQFYTLYYSDNSSVFTQRVNVSEEPPGGASSNYSFVIEDLAKGTEYSLWLSSSTDYGEGRARSDVVRISTMEDVPDGPIHNLTAQNVSSTALVVSWDPPLSPNGKASYHLTLREEHLNQFSTNLTIRKTTMEQAFLFTKLRKYTDYIVTVTPATSAGYSENTTAVLYMRTDDDVPSSPPLFLSSRNLSSSSVHFSWLAPLEPNGVLTEYSVGLQGPGGPNTTLTPNTSLTLTGLMPFSPYNVSIAAGNRRGLGPPLTFLLRTDEAGPASPPRTLTLYNHTADSVWLTWEPSLEPNGLVQFYGFRILELLRQALSFQNTTGPSTRAQLSGFRPRGEYQISVSSYTRAGNGDQYSDPVTFVTNNSVPEPVRNLSCSGRSWNSVFLEWDAPDQSTGELTHYLIRYGAEEEEELEPNALWLTLSGLQPLTNYSFLLLGVNSAGVGEGLSCNASTLPESVQPPMDQHPILGQQQYSMSLHASETRVKLRPDGHCRVEVASLSRVYRYLHCQAVPGPPDHLNVTQVRETSLTLAWTPPVLVPGQLRGYRVRVELLSRHCEDREQPGCVESVELVLLNATAGTQEVTLQPLLKYRHYRLSVSARTGAGFGNASRWVTARTLPGDPDYPPRLVSVTPSSSSAKIEWDEPEQLAGPTSYLIHISSVDGPVFNLTLEKAPDEPGSVQAYNLTAYTLYQVTVVAFTGNLSSAWQRGAASEPVFFRTLEEQPKDPPKNVTLQVIPEEVTRVFVTFSPPAEPNGNISGYQVQIYLGDELEFQIADLRIVRAENDTLTGVIEGLKGGRSYRILISAVNGAGPGPSSEVHITTGVTVPPKPTRKPQAATDRHGAVMATARTITILKPVCFFSDENGPIEKVQVIVAEEKVMDDGNLTNWKIAFDHKAAPYISDNGFPNPVCPEDAARRVANDDTYVIGEDNSCLALEKNSSLCNGPLKPKTLYVFKFRAVNTEGGFTDSEYSELVRTEDSQWLTRDEQIILGVLLSFFLALLLILIIYASVRIHQKQKEGGTYSPREAEIIETKFKLDQLIAVSDLELKEEKLNRYSSFFFRRKEIFVIQLLSYRKSLKPVNKKSFLQHVEDLCANDNIKFQEEFSELPKLLHDLATSDADLPWNRSKNRFTNIKPYNNNRVKLLSQPGVPGSDYINASFVSGYLCPNEFIATQGPLPGTVADFWRMIWETRSRTIAMLTQCFEKGRIRCHQYWPEDNKPVTVFGDIVITKLTEDVFPDWTVRVIKVEKPGEYMVVNHFNFTSWPEHGVPESSTTLIQFVKTIRAHRGHDNTTMVVHCSAGVGRTGVFIGLDHLVQHVSDHDFVDVYGLVAELRSERMCMVQNLAQYMFLHQSTLDLLNSRGNSQSVWFVSYSALEKMDSLDAMEGDVELEWEETTM